MRPKGWDSTGPVIQFKGVEMEMIEVARFSGPAVPGSELQEAVNAAVAEVAEDPGACAELAGLGLDAQAVRGVEIRVDQKPGLDPASIALAILIGTSGQLTANAVQSLWAMVLRRVRKRKGYDAFGDPLDR